MTSKELFMADGTKRADGRFSYVYESIPANPAQIRAYISRNLNPVVLFLFSVRSGNSLSAGARAAAAAAAWAHPQI